MAQDQQIAVELVGYLKSAVGVGEAARRYVAALRAGGVGVLERDVPLPGRDHVHTTTPTPGDPPDPHDIAFDILCLNPEQMVPYLDSGAARRPAKRTTIGIWSWEVDLLPSGWREASRRVDEIWTYSSFAASLVARWVVPPVRIMPLPVSSPQSVATNQLDLPAGFRFLVMFDFLSTLERKNPLGAIDAYRRAFGPNDGTALVIKSVNSRHRPKQQAKVLAAIEGRPDIALIDRTITAQERDALIAACDCVVSLHRSEGYGLPLAEAMAIGRPVVATAYGGNMEFMSDTNSYPVSWTLASVGNGVEHYPAGATWAEPDIQHAAHALRTVRCDAHDREHRVARAQQDVLRKLAFDVVGRQMATRLESLSIERGGVRDRLLSKLLATARHAHR